MPSIAPRVQTKAGKGAFDIWEKALALEASGIDIIHFEVGEPDFTTPDHIVAAANQALADGYTMRTLDYRDEAAVRHILEQVRDSDLSARSLLRGIALSRTFRHRELSPQSAVTVSRTEKP